MQKKLPKIANSWLRQPPKFMLFSAISVIFFFEFWQFYLVTTPLIGFGRLDLPTEPKKNFIPEFYLGIAPKLRPGKAWVTNLQFLAIFLHRLIKCITLSSILVNDLSLAIVRIPLFYIFTLISMYKKPERVLWNSFGNYFRA